MEGDRAIPKAPGSEPVRPHLPVAAPAGEMAAAELQHDARVDRIEAGHGREALDQVALRAAPAGEIDQRRLDHALDLLLCHAERERVDDVAALTRLRGGGAEQGANDEKAEHTDL